MESTGLHQAVKCPGTLQAMDDSLRSCGVYPITPSAQIGEGWAVAKGKPELRGRQLIFFQPGGEHAAAVVVAGIYTHRPESPEEQP